MKKELTMLRKAVAAHRELNTAIMKLAEALNGASLQRLDGSAWQALADAVEEIEQNMDSPGDVDAELLAEVRKAWDAVSGKTV